FANWTAQRFAPRPSPRRARPRPPITVIFAALLKTPSGSAELDSPTNARAVECAIGPASNALRLRFDCFLEIAHGVAELSRRAIDHHHGTVQVSPALLVHPVEQRVIVRIRVIECQSGVVWRRNTAVEGPRRRLNGAALPRKRAQQMLFFDKR